MKKLLALALVMILALSPLAGCGDNGSTPGGSGNTGGSGSVGGSESTQSGSAPDITPSGNNTADAWPNNEWTQQVPKPSFDVDSSAQMGRDFNINFKGITYDEAKAYAQELSGAGFVQQTTGANWDRTNDFSWWGINADGWEATICNDPSFMIIVKPES